jgi:ABC-type Fe3+ transport system substrate-binding protein
MLRYAALRAALSMTGSVALAAVLAFPAFAQVSPEMAKTIEAANKEGTLKLIWSGSTLGGAAGAKQAEEAMRKMYGATFSIRFAPGAGSMAEVGSTVLAEMKANRPASTDVYIGPTTFVARFADAGMFQKADWTALAPGRITSEMVEANGEAVRFVSFVAGMTYNSRLLPNPPRTVEGWLDPKLKGKLASTTAAAGLDVLAANDFWGEAKTLAFSEKLSSQLAGLIRCGETNRMASGEFWALIFDCGGSDAYLAKARGAPIDQVVARDFVQLRFFYLGVPKNSASPNAAKAYIAFMMTPEGQKLAWDTWAEDLHMFPGSNMGKKIDALKAEGANPRVLDIKWTNHHPETGVAREKILKIMRATAQ